MWWGVPHLRLHPELERVGHLPEVRHPDPRRADHADKAAGQRRLQQPRQLRDAVVLSHTTPRRSGPFHAQEAALHHNPR